MSSQDGAPNRAAATSCPTSGQGGRIQRISPYHAGCPVLWLQEKRSAEILTVHITTVQSISLGLLRSEDIFVFQAIYDPIRFRISTLQPRLFDPITDRTELRLEGVDAYYVSVELVQPMESTTSTWLENLISSKQ